MAEKPLVLIIGGLGYIGRFLALHIHKNNLAAEVRIVDKVLPQLAWLPPEFEDACAGSKFVQADASRERTEFLLAPFFPPASPARLHCLSRVHANSAFHNRVSCENIRQGRREAMGLRLQLRR